jgi:LysM repeat protein
MNKETKIGLLTGLGVIVIIGVLLSEYLGQPGSGSSSMASAALGNLGAPYRERIMNPIGVVPVVNPEVATSAPATAAGDPTTPIANAQPIANASVNPGSQSVPSMTSVGTLGTPVVKNVPDDQTSMNDPALPAPQPAIVNSDTQVQPAVFVPANGNTPALNAANALGDDKAVQLVSGSTTPVATAPAPTPSVTYTVGKGDTLTLICKKIYHSATNANQKKIVAANPTVLKSTASPLKIGMKLIVPDAPKAVVAPKPIVTAAGTTPAGKMKIAVPGKSATNVAPLPASAGTPKAAKATVYTVQKGDTLAKIAKKTLGSATHANMLKIAKLNGFAIDDSLDVGDVLHLPVK